MLSLRSIALGATLASAALVATPAAAADIVDPCSATWVTGGIACVGYVNGNLTGGQKGTTIDSTALALINQLLSGTPNGAGSGLTTTAAYSPSYGSLSSSATVLAYITDLAGSATLNFGPGVNGLGSATLNGLTVVGLHFGNTPDAQPAGAGPGQPNTNVSAFWLVNLTSPTQTLTLTNGAGSSNAQILATRLSAPVPEPATWALMLLGFGGMGLAMRRTRRQALLTQMA